jgi:LysM repeat protein
VQPGDTLSAIAQRCQVSLPALEAANPRSDPLAIGRILQVPAPAAAPAPAPGQAAQTGSGAGAPAGGVMRYVVRPGDTLSAVALRFGTTVAVLARYNGLADPNKLSVGQVLGIPTA